VLTWLTYASSTANSSALPLVAQTGQYTLLAKQTPKAWPCLCMSAWIAVPGYHITTLPAFCWFRLQACLASAKLPLFGRYSFVIYPNLKGTPSGRLKVSKLCKMSRRRGTWDGSRLSTLATRLEFEPHWRPLPAKLPSFGGYSQETSPSYVKLLNLKVSKRASPQAVCLPVLSDRISWFVCFFKSKQQYTSYMN